MLAVPKLQVSTVPEVVQPACELVIVAMPASAEKSTASFTFVAVPVGAVVVSTLSPTVRSLPGPGAPTVASPPQMKREIGFEAAWAGAAARPPATSAAAIAARLRRRAPDDGLSDKVPRSRLE